MTIINNKHWEMTAVKTAQLREVVVNDVEADAEEQSAYALANALEQIAAATESITTEAAEQQPSVLSRVKRARVWADKQLEHGEAEETDLQTRLATANAAYDNVVANAARERDAILAEVNATLKDATGLREALAIFKGELLKREL